MSLGSVISLSDHNIEQHHVMSGIKLMPGAAVQRPRDTENISMTAPQASHSSHSLTSKYP